MLENTVFFILLFVQCGLVSWYLPSLLYKRMRRVITEYPPQQYPLLYPKAEEKYHRFHRRFKLAYQCIFSGSVLIVCFALLEGVSLEEGIWAMLPWFLFMVQMIPNMVVEVSEFSHARLLREKNKNKIRVAGMASRNVLDLISRSLFVSWLSIQLLCIAAIGWVDNFQFVIGNSAFWSVLIIVFANVAGAAYLKMLVSGKNQDPHQAPEDKFRASKGVAKSMLYISIGVSLFGAVMQVVNHYELQRLEPIIMCIYCQVIALVSIPTILKATSLEKLNFDVYRES